jgi:SAM-dependent methyltransferase
VTLNDPALVRAEYGTDERFRRRSLYEWAIYEGPDPREHALLALHEGRPDRILDVGCGTGESAARAASVLGAAVVGLDQSERMVELTRARGIEAVVGDVQDLPFADGEFDAVTASWMLYHVPDLDRGLAEIARVLRPSGRLVALHNGERHLHELWGVDHDDTFTAEKGLAALARHFASVEAREVRGAAIFVTRENLRGYLSAFETLHRKDETWRADELAVPLRVTCLNSILIAEKRA